MKEKYYLTTAIAYTSGKPHIGNTYEIILNDAIARYKRQQGFDVFFLTGTDEHGIKIEEKATSSEKRYQNNSKVEAMVERRQFRTDLDRDTNDEKNDFHNLSAIFYRRIAPMGNIPSKVGLVELLPSKIIQDYIKTSWSMSNVTKSLAVPIGKNEYGPVTLDLHEKGDGPHMLVAGTTGSGKSETVISYLVSLCATYSPMDLNLMLVDMKGGGFSNRLKDLPHCVGVVDDVAGEDEGFPSTYMLKRFLEVLNAEIKRRKICLSEFGVDNIDAYIEIEKIKNTSNIYPRKAGMPAKQPL